VEYARRISSLSPGDYQKRVFFSNSGAESVECAIKAAKFSTQRPGMVAFVGGFHGRTMGALALTSSSAVARRRFTSSLMPDVAFAPYAYCYRCPFNQHRETCALECLRYLEEWVLGKVMPVEDCAAIVVEPIQGAGGYIVPPPAFLQGLERICRERGLLFIVDEVQTGFGKTGALFACDYFGITPDILCISKAIAAGLPMGATITRSTLLEWELNSHENTLGGNPVVMAAALAVLDVFEEENLTAAAVRIGERLAQGLKRLQDRFEIIGDVRSAGAMVGIEFVKDRQTKEPARDARDRFMKECFERGLLTLGAGPCSVRLAPPLILTDQQVDTGLSIMEEVLAL
jgi:4-aminobutyrate aminotransferase